MVPVNYVKLQNLCVIQRRTIFEEQLSMAERSVGQSLRSRILESSPKLSKILAMMVQSKQMFVMKHFLKKVLRLKNYQ